MHWLLWVAGAFVVLYGAWHLFIVPNAKELGKGILGQMYDRASPEARAKLMREVNQKARSTNDPKEEKMYREFQNIDSWANYTSLSDLGNTRLSI